MTTMRTITWVFIAGALVIGCRPASETGDETAAAPDPPATDAGTTAPVVVEPEVPEEPAPEGGVVSNAGNFYVVCTPEPDAIPLNEPFSLNVRVYEADRQRRARRIRIEADGRMPDHRHGMNREPKVRPNPDGSFTVDNMLFHMPGFWELHVDIIRTGVTERAQIDVELQ